MRFWGRNKVFLSIKGQGKQMAHPAHTPLLFIHGMWSRPQVWLPFQEHFQALGYSVHTPALPAHEGTPQDPPAALLSVLTLQDYVEALAKVAEALPTPPVLIGHSMGGLLAQLLAVRIKPKALVLLSTAPSSSILSLDFAPIKTLWPIISQWGFWNKSTRLPQEQALWGIFNGIAPEEAQAEAQALLPDSGRALFQIALPWLDRSNASRVDYQAITCPTLLVCGDQDRVTPLEVSRATARRLPGEVTYRELDGFGHWILGSQGQPKVFAHLEQFLQKL
jgi:pimeloyl-ACP methyl ester carboxylesterase